jgi:hypothetical protein
MGTQSVQTTATKLGRCQALLSDEDVRRWYNNLKRASEITADVRLRRLGKYCEEIRMQPKELVEKDPQIVTDILGLHSALKLNNMTHEHFTIEEVVNDSLLRPRPMSIAAYKFKFVKLSAKLLGFGVKEKGIVRYSDPEKTILDFIYTWRYNGIPEDKIVLDVSEWSEGLSKENLRKYAENYPKSVARIMDSVIT